MLKTAYQLGVLAACDEAGFSKEAGTTTGVLKALGGRIKDIGRPLREAVMKMREGPFSPTISPSGKVLIPGTTTRDLQLDVVREAVPWLVGLGIPALGYGGYKLLPNVFPDIEKSPLERLISTPYGEED